MGALRGAVVLVTGGTGSFAHEAIPAIAHEEPREIRALAHSEYGLFLARESLRAVPVNWQLCDIRDRTRVEAVLRGVDFCIHAAALKHIPVAEQFPLEAVQTNVTGTAHVVEAARAAGVRCLVSLSADKAVYPVSVYGATKLLGEALVTAANDRPERRFVSIRYGNVLGSRGSVVELFRNRIAAGQAIQVFGSAMTRFFLTQREVVELCLDVFDKAAGGEVLVKEARPMRVADLATAVTRIMGRGEVVVSETDDAYERLDAMLLSAAESRQAVRHKDLFIINRLKRQHGWQPAEPVPVKDYTIADYESMGIDEIIARLRPLFR